MLFLAFSRAASAGEAPSFDPAELDLGRVYRGVKRPFTLRAESSPGAALVLDISPPVTPTGGRAVGVSIRTPGRRLTAGADGRLAVECGISVLPNAMLGRAEAEVTLTDAAGRRAEARIGFVVSQRRLAAPALLDFGEAFIRGKASAGLALRIESPRGASAWLEWSDLAGETGGAAGILRAFVRLEKRAVELPPDADVAVPVEVELPRGTRPGAYRGTLTVTAGPFRADVELAVRAILPRISTDPELVDLGAVAPDRLAAGAFTAELEGAAPERFEAELEGPLSKTGRPEALLDCLTVETAAGEIAPGEGVSVSVFGTVPAGQEDGVYQGIIILRAGASRRRVPAKIDVPRPEGLAEFELEPLELLLHARRGEDTHAALRVRSNVDRGIELTASLTPPEDSRWVVEFGGDPLSPEEYVMLVPARGEAEIPIVARAPEGAPLGERTEACVTVTGVEGDAPPTARSDVTLEVARAAPKPEPVKPSPAGRIALAAFALACALTAAASWRIRPLRYGAASAGVHALVLTFGVRSPFMSAPAGAGGGEPPFAVRVMQLDDPYGEESWTATKGEAAAAEGVPEAAGGPLPEPVAVPEPTVPGADAGEAETGAPAWLAVPIPSHPDAPARPEPRESLEVARAPARLPGPPAARDSDGFDLEGPRATLSLLEAGEIRLACFSSQERFGAFARERLRGVFARGAPNLVEEVPAGALAAAVEEAETRAGGAGRSASRLTTSTTTARRTSHPAREPADFTGPAPRRGPRDMRRATLKIARLERPHVPPVLRGGERPRLGALPREVAPEVMPTKEPPRGEKPERLRPPARPRPPEVTKPAREIPRPPRTLTPARRVDLAREALLVPVPVAGAREVSGLAAERPSESVTERPPPSEGPRPVVPRRPPEPTGRQTITRARGRSPAGIAGRIEESFARPGARPTRLPSARAPLSRRGSGPAASKLLNPSRGRALSGRVRAVRAGVVFGTLRHAGEWNVSPRAMGVLVKELPARQPGFDLEVRAMPVRATEPELLDCALLYVTGRRAPLLSELEIERLAGYLRQGGFIWVDDGAPPGNSTFDRAVRRLLGSLVPGGCLRRVPFSNQVFTCSYDLARGYLGRALPGGAWVKQEELEGLFTPEGKLVAVYTRNGYGPAMEVDANREAGFRPPAGLTPREAREGALRAGVNIAVVALRSGGEVLPEGRARETFDPSLRYRYRGGGIEPVRGAWAPARWREMRGSGGVRLARRGGVAAKGGALAVEFVASEKDWAGVEAAAPAGLASARAVVFDVECLMHAPARVALRMRTQGGTLYESVPLYVRPGANENLRVPLDAADFRSSATGWRAYDAMPDRSSPPALIGFVFYGRDLAGKAVLSDLRFEGWAAATR